MDIEKIIANMTLEEKATLCSGLGFWQTQPCERLGVPSAMMCDGPHGLRKMAKDANGKGYTVKATCFPTASALASSFDRELIAEAGKAIADEAAAEDVSLLLGPGINIKRSPLCGRNFEYFSEDPYLAGEMASAFINGVQSRGVGACVKHFAVNNQETRRFTSSSNLNERTLREIYLPAFERVIKKSSPAAVMTSYNRINGRYANESEYLVRGILRGEWGFDGMVVSDWDAVSDRVAALLGGTELEMPSSSGDGARQIVAAVGAGKLSEAVVDEAVTHILEFVNKLGAPAKRAAETELHNATARKVASECMVLLKNDNNMLPLAADGKPYALIGAMTEKPRRQGSGSSKVESAMCDNFRREFEAVFGTAEYAAGYSLDSSAPDAALIAEAVAAAKKCTRAVLVIGLPESYEAEGRDREHMRLPECQNALVEALLAETDNIAIVLIGGSPVEMPWRDKAKTVLLTYLCGQAAGGALADVLSGKVNPSGRLAETFPIKLSDTPAYLSFGGATDETDYGEGIYVGYRWYEKREIPVAFPFGYGLSYTAFKYDKIEISGDRVSVTVTNTGDREGKETVQLYVGEDKPRVSRPKKELRGFEKLSLAAGETKKVEFTLCDEDFRYFDPDKHEFAVEGGEYTVYAGGNSSDTPLTAKIHRERRVETHKIDKNTVISDILENPEYAAARECVIDGMFGGTDYDKYRAEFGCTLKNPAVARRKTYVLRQAVYFNPRVGEREVEKIIEKANALLGK